VNLIDLGLLAIIGVCVLVGLKGGSLRSLISIGVFFLSFVLCLVLVGTGTRGLLNNEKLYNQLLYFSEGNEMLGTAETSMRDIETFTAEEISLELKAAEKIPPSIVKVIEANVAARAFASQNAKSLGGYIDRSFTDLVISVGYFILLFLIIFVALQIVASMVITLWPLPKLAHFDGWVAGIAGGLLGVLICMVLLCAFPVVQSVLPVQMVNDMISGSRIARMVGGINFVLPSVFRSFPR